MFIHDIKSLHTYITKPKAKELPFYFWSPFESYIEDFNMDPKFIPQNCLIDVDNATTDHIHSAIE